MAAYTSWYTYHSTLIIVWRLRPSLELGNYRRSLSNWVIIQAAPSAYRHTATHHVFPSTCSSVPYYSFYLSKFFLPLHPYEQPWRTHIYPKLTPTSILLTVLIKSCHCLQQLPFSNIYVCSSHSTAYSYPSCHMYFLSPCRLLLKLYIYTYKDTASHYTMYTQNECQTLWCFYSTDITHQLVNMICPTSDLMDSCEEPSTH